MNIFISKNAEKDEVFDKLTDKLDVKRLKNEIKFIFKKVYNNYVGYYLFKDNAKVFKIFVLPKNISLPQNKDEEIKTIKKFLNYLKEHYKLRSTYSEYKNDSLALSSFSELSFNTTNSKKSAQSIEQLVFYKYKSIIQEIIIFFNSHKSHKKVKTNYISQSIKYKIDLAKNIKEINKTKVHQEKSEDIIYSQIATVAYGTIKLFIRQKIDIIEDEKDRKKLLKLALKLQNILLKKYNIDRGYNLSLTKLISSKTYKYFRKKDKHKHLHINLLTLFGIENFYDEDSNKEINQNIQTDSLFLRPELMYEWFVYDYLIQNNILGATKDNIFIQSHKDYFLKIDNTKKVLKSKPDIIIDSKKKIIIDAKWKKIKKDDFSPSDILKLQRDFNVHNADEAYLIYLYLDINQSSKEPLHVEYNSKNKFTFNILQIGINL